ncbi:ABC transporter permease [Nesterenkonia populi]|uniref:ABC transporter permease n=1 Tax=Nesterenkonia populi TaxID=1591087 RepID=UPI0011BE703F|nr:ABC transporter permease [Nesterenkonia populi]
MSQITATAEETVTASDSSGTPPHSGTGETPPPPARKSASAAYLSALGWGLVGFAAVVLLWWVFAPDRLPAPPEVGARIIEDISDPFGAGGIAILLGLSLGRVLEGFALAAAVGIPLGLAMGTSTKWWNSANPVAQLLRPVSPLAWFPIFAVIFMDSEQASIWVIFITALWPIAINTAAGASAIPEDQKKVAQVFKFGRAAYIRHVLLPNTFASIVTGMRLAFGMAWLVIVAVEMLGTAVGIGNDTWEAYNGSRFDQMMANILWIGLIGLVVDWLFLKAVDVLSKKENKS